MFDEAEAQVVRRGWAFWLSIAFCIAAALFVLNLIRVNVPERTLLASPTPFVESHTEGKIASEIARVEAGGILPYRANFNHRVTVKGQFRSDKSGPWVTFLILNEGDYEKWRSGAEFTPLVSTGKVPMGKVNRVLGAGVYYFVFDNRPNDKDVVIDIDLSAN